MFSWGRLCFAPLVSRYDFFTPTPTVDRSCSVLADPFPRFCAVLPQLGDFAGVPTRLFSNHLPRR